MNKIKIIQYNTIIKYKCGMREGQEHKWTWKASMNTREAFQTLIEITFCF